MASRIIQIEVRGDGSSYEATVNRIIEKNNQLSRSATQGTQQTIASFRILERGLGALNAAFAGAFSIGAVVAFGRQVLNTAGQLADLSERTGISAQTLSGLRTVLEQNGTSVEAFARAISIAQRNLVEAGEESDKAAKALRFIGLNVDQLRQANPDQFLKLFAQGLSGVQNQADRTAIAMAVLGRGGAELAPTIVKLAGDLDNLKKQGLSEDTIQKLDQLGDAFTRLKNRIIDFTANALVTLLQKLDLLPRSMQQLEQQLAHAEKFAPGDIATRRKLERDLVEARERQDQAELTQRPQLPSTFRPDNAADRQAETKRNQAAAEAVRRAQQGAEAIARLNIEQAKLNLQNLENARTTGLLSDAQLQQGLTVGNLDDAIRQASLALFEQEKQAALTAAANDKILTPALRAAIEQQYSAKVATFEASEQTRRQKELLELAKKAAEGDAQAQRELAEVLEAQARDRDIINQRTLEAIELERQLGNEQADHLAIIGKTQEAEAARLQTLIQYLEKQKELEKLQGKGTEALRDQQILNAQTQLERVGRISVDIGQHIGDTLNNIFDSLISGTLKSVDVGKAALATIGNIATDVFRQAITKKLTFELEIFNNLRAMPGQAQGALSAGVAATPGGAGNGGIFSALFGGGSGGGGFGGGLGNLFGGVDWLTTLINETPFLTGNGAGGLLGGGITSQGLSSFLGVLGGIIPIISNFASGNIGGGIGGTLGGGVGALFAGPVGFGIGSLLGSLVGGLFNSTPNPTVRVRAQIEGFVYDALANAFKFGDITTKASGTDISGSMVKQTRTEVQAILEQQSKAWTDILNLFPAIVHDEMLPAMENANKLLEQQFARLKFSEGGSRSIAEEISHLAERGAPGKFFLASRGLIGAGLAASFGAAGLGGLDLSNFAGLPADLGKINLNKFRGGGLTVPKKQEDVAAFVEALQQFVGTAGGLAGISARGVTPFLTGADMTMLRSSFAGVLGITEGNQFTAAVEQLQQKIQPVLDFLNKSLQDTANIFGTGMVAALEAASESEAVTFFQRTIGEGTKDILFKGITEAFLASAQYNDLLAPIQKTIREFTERAVATGRAPDVEAFRRAILPGIDQIQTRAEMLEPLVRELQKLGYNIRDLLGILPEIPEAVREAIPEVVPERANIVINIDQFLGGETDMNNLVRRIDDLLRAQNPPS